MKVNSKGCWVSPLQGKDMDRKALGQQIERLFGSWDLKRDSPRGDLRRWLKIPDHVVFVPPQRSKVPIHWMACVVNGVLPDTTKVRWETFQCSHRCIEAGCFNPDHLCWESASLNQERANSFCRQKCTHNGCTKGRSYCECLPIHSPHCL